MMDMDRVPWVSKKEIERKAALILKDAGAKMGLDIVPPVPIEAIIEQVYDLHLLVEDLTEIYSEHSWAEDLLGATIISRRQVLIHENLLSDPREHGRYHFTCAHELAHWVLHRPLFEEPGAGAGQEAADVDILCRTSQARKRAEWQADYMAACLLMPEIRTRRAYHTAVSDKPLLLVNRESSVSKKCRRPIWLEPVMSHVPYFAEEVMRAGNFTNVSKSAMGIRLQELGLLVNAVDRPWMG
jgi:hypothetical protein